MGDINPHRAMLKDKLRQTVLKVEEHRASARRLSDSLRVDIDYNLRDSVSELDAESIDRDTRMLLRDLAALAMCEQRIKAIEADLYG